MRLSLKLALFLAASVKLVDVAKSRRGEGGYRPPVPYLGPPPNMFGMHPDFGPPGMGPDFGPPEMGPNFGPPGMGPNFGPPGMGPNVGPPGMGPNFGHPGMGPDFGPPAMGPDFGPPAMSPDFGPPVMGQVFGPSVTGQVFGPPATGPDFRPPEMSPDSGHPVMGSVVGISVSGQDIGQNAMGPDFGPPGMGPDFGPPAMSPDFGPPVIHQVFGPSVRGQFFGPPAMGPDFGPPVIGQVFGSPAMGPDFGPPATGPDFRPPGMSPDFGPPGMSPDSGHPVMGSVVGISVSGQDFGQNAMGPDFGPPGMGPDFGPPVIGQFFGPSVTGQVFGPPAMGPDFGPPAMSPDFGPPVMGPVLGPSVTGQVFVPPAMSPDFRPPDYNNHFPHPGWPHNCHHNMRPVIKTSKPTTATTITTTTSASAPSASCIPSQVLAFFQLLATLPLLLNGNVFTNQMTSTTTEVPLPRLMRRAVVSVDDGYCHGQLTTAQNNSLQMLLYLVGNRDINAEGPLDLYNVPQQVRQTLQQERNKTLLRYLKLQDVCVLQALTTDLECRYKQTETIDIIKKFLITPQTGSTVRKDIYSNFAIAMAKSGIKPTACSSNGARNKRDFGFYNGGDSNLRLDYGLPVQELCSGDDVTSKLFGDISMSLVNAIGVQNLDLTGTCQNVQRECRSFTTYGYEEYALYCIGTTTPSTPTTTPAPASINAVLNNVFPEVLSSLGVGESSLTSVVDNVLAAYPVISQLIPSFKAVLKCAAVPDIQAMCFTLALCAETPGMTPGYKTACEMVLNFYKCKANTSLPVTAVPIPPPTTTVPPITTTTTTTTTTTPNPNRCGVSSDLTSVTNVADRSLVFTMARIVGGTVTGSCSLVPWQVRLNINNTEMCGGSIIDATHILTAAHCVNNMPPDLLQVIAGDYNLAMYDPNEQVRAVSQVQVHPDYKFVPTFSTLSYTFENDIAVLTLNSPLKMSPDNPCAVPICRDPSFTPDGKSCTVSGWGATLSGSQQASLLLQRASMPTYSGDKCMSAFSIPDNYYISDTDIQLCAGLTEGGVDSCQGDSGGPLVCLNPATNSYVQVGIVSYGYLCAQANFPGIYTNVAAYNDWINNAIA